MKEFKDLEFKEHKSNGLIKIFDSQARINFENGYGVSVITGTGAYSSDKAPYEVGIIYNDALCYSTHITDDVVGYCTKEKVSEIMKQVQELKAK